MEHRSAAHRRRLCALATLSIVFGPPVMADPKSGLASPEKRPVAEIVVSQVPRLHGARVAGPDENPMESVFARRPPPDGSRLVLVRPLESGPTVLPLSTGFSSAGRPDISFDGRRMLFVARRRAGEKSGIWEMSLDDRSTREVLRLPTDCVRAVYLSTMYTLNAASPEYRIAVETLGPDPYPRSIFTSRLDGSDLRQATYSPLPASDPVLLSDGRLLFISSVPTASEPTSISRAGLPPYQGGTEGGPPQPTGTPCAPADESSRRTRDRAGTALFTVYPDGSDLSAFAGTEEMGLGRFSPCETTGGDVVFVNSDRTGCGQLMAVPRTASTLPARSLSQSSDGCCRSVSSLSDGRLLVSFRASSSPDDRGFGIRAFDPISRSFGDIAFDDPEWDDVEAVPVAPRREPAGHSTATDPTGRTGQLYCLNAYISDGRSREPFVAGSLKRVRVFGAVTDGSSASRAQGESVSAYEPPETRASGGVVLGEGTVDEDGSFFLEVPAARPLRLALLDGNGEVVRTMRNWMWVMPGERRGCIGCHEDRERTPPNRHAYALRRPPQRIGLGDVPRAPAAAGEPHGREKR